MSQRSVPPTIVNIERTVSAARFEDFSFSGGFSKAKRISRGSDLENFIIHRGFIVELKKKKWIRSLNIKGNTYMDRKKMKNLSCTWQDFLGIHRATLIVIGWIKIDRKKSSLHIGGVTGHIIIAFLVVVVRPRNHIFVKFFTRSILLHSVWLQRCRL